ncbi:Tas Predicted oxidoreductases (related to aryl-alcohol dehydrogenases) [Candidatus Nanopelagicaceae bacterium]
MRHSQLIQIHGTDVKVSRLSLGTAPLGGLFKSVPETESDAVIQEALDAGIAYIDTAPLYGYGVGEVRVGRGIKGHHRQPVISTKVGRLLRPGKNLEYDKFPDSDPNIEIYFDNTAAGIRKSLEESLKRLERDSVEIAYIHDADNWVREAIEVVYPELHKMRSEGLIKAIGVGMNWCPTSIAIMKETELNIALIAGRFTLLDQSAQEELYPLALKKNVSIIAAGVFNSGVLANPVPGAYYDYEPASHEIIEKARAIGKYLEKFDISLPAAALQFPLRHPAVASVLTGAGSVKELRENISNFDAQIPENLWSQMEAEGLISKIPT